MNPSFLAHLKERKLGQWGLAYLGAAWLLLQLLSMLAQPFAWPDLVMRVATVLLALGLPVVLVLAWYHSEKGSQRVSGIELLMLAGILALAGAGSGAVVTFSFPKRGGRAESATLMGARFTRTEPTQARPAEGSEGAACEADRSPGT